MLNARVINKINKDCRTLCMGGNVKWYDRDVANTQVGCSINLKPALRNVFQIEGLE
jgi:hypothetical protein